MDSVPRLSQRFNQSEVYRQEFTSRGCRLRTGDLVCSDKVTWYRSECLLETVVATNIGLTLREFQI
jgi:hypothetical protein